MLRVRELQALDNSYLEELGFLWHTDEDESPYLADRVVEKKKKKAKTYKQTNNKQ